MHILPLRGALQHYSWGSIDPNSATHRIINYADAYKSLELLPDKPLAEIWLGTHHRGLTMVQFENQWTPLTKLLSRHDNNPDLPYLVKVLSVSSTLSIQLHPNREQAQALHASAPDLYPDNSPKPEMAIALSPLSLLCGFRPWPEIKTLIDSHPLFLKVATICPKLKVARSPLSATTSLFELSDSELQSLSDYFEKGSLRDAKTIYEVVASSAFRTHRKVDVGMLFAYFLKHWDLLPGEAVFIPHGIPHAYIHGDLFECMLTSDNVVRAGLTSKAVDSTSFLRMVCTTPIDCKIPGSTKGHITQFSIDELPANVMHLKGDFKQGLFESEPAEKIVCINLDGTLKLNVLDQKLQLSAGDSCYIDLVETPLECIGTGSNAIITSAKRL